MDGPEKACFICQFPVQVMSLSLFLQQAIAWNNAALSSVRPPLVLSLHDVYECKLYHV